MSHNPEIRQLIKDKLLHKLYEQQVKYWNSQLIQLAQANARSYGRQDSQIYNIYFNNRKWSPDLKNLAFAASNVYCLPLNTEFSDLVSSMETISKEIQELEQEKYEAERFISGLLLFHHAPNSLKAIFGDALYAASGIHTFVKYIETDNAVLPSTLKEYVIPNKEILKKMNERLVLNMITADKL